MNLLIGASLLTAFLAGLAALFAPCCITVLLPAYFGSVFRQRKAVFLMTFVFFLGLLTVFLPLGLGIAALAQFFQAYHSQLYLIGAAFLLFTGGALLLGKRFSLKFATRVKARAKFIDPAVTVDGAGSVFSLGIFSGFATLCCAPVLAGAVALSALPGSLFWGGIYSLTYALGMVLPLFFIAFFLDKINFTEKFIVFKNKISYNLFGRIISLSIAELVAGITFIAMGLLIVYLALTDQLAMKSDNFNLSVNLLAARANEALAAYFEKVPAAIWLLIIGLLAGLIVKLALFSSSKKQK